MEAVDYLNQGNLCQAEAQTQHQNLRGNEHFLWFVKCCELDRAASWRLTHEVKTISRGVSHGKSLLLSQPCPRFTVPDRGEHVWFLLNPRIRSAEWKIRRDCLSFLSTRCLIYEWIMSERRFSHWKSKTPTAWPFLVKGTVRRLWEDRKSVWVSGGMGAKSESDTHGVSVRRTVVTLTPKLIRSGDAVWWRASKQGWMVEKVGHTSCLRKWVSIIPACAVHNKEDGTPSAVATATSG